jgi:hypothetical protein
MKNVDKFIGIVIWIIVAICALDTAFYALSAASTILNILGFLALAIFVFISYASNCFTNWKKYDKKFFKK